MTGGDIIAAFKYQAEACRELGSPFTARVCELFAARLKHEGFVSRALLDWPADGSAKRAAVPLRIAGALHALVLEGRDENLRRTYPPHAATDDELWEVIAQALERHESFIMSRLELAPQTNEVRRSAALLPGMLVVASLTGCSFALTEIGSSAGLNLILDKYNYRLGGFSWGNPDSPVLIAPDWEGEPPPDVDLKIADRTGCDLTPLNPADPSDCLRLLSYIWADQTDRLERTSAALQVACQNGVRIESADVVDWLPGRLAETKIGQAHVIYHSIMWQYMPEKSQHKVESIIREAGFRAFRSAPVAWLRLEPDTGSPQGASLKLTLWPSGEERTLARADFHGRWVHWAGWKS